MPRDFEFDCAFSEWERIIQLRCSRYVQPDGPQRLGWALEDDMDDLLPTMQSDVMLTYGDRILIIDAKYYEQTMRSRFLR